METEYDTQMRIDNYLDQIVNAHRIEQALRHAERIRFMAHYRYLEAMATFYAQQEKDCAG